MMFLAKFKSGFNFRIAGMIFCGLLFFTFPVIASEPVEMEMAYGEYELELSPLYQSFESDNEVIIELSLNLELEKYSNIISYKNKLNERAGALKIAEVTDGNPGNSFLANIGQNGIANLIKRACVKRPNNIKISGTNSNGTDPGSQSVVVTNQNKGKQASIVNQVVLPLFPIPTSCLIISQSENKSKDILIIDSKFKISVEPDFLQMVEHNSALKLREISLGYSKASSKRLPKDTLNIDVLISRTGALHFLDYSNRLSKLINKDSFNFYFSLYIHRDFNCLIKSA